MVNTILIDTDDMLIVFNALRLLVGQQEGHPTCKKYRNTTLFLADRDSMVATCCLQVRNTVIAAGGKLP